MLSGPEMPICMAEAYRQLNDSNHYQKLTYDPTLETAETKRLANKLHTSDIIDNTTHKFLTIDNQARTPQLYLLPKIHKQDNPGRPIISGCGGPTVKLSQYADHRPLNFAEKLRVRLGMCRVAKFR